jgi:ATP-dependent exoDNAse (exonuclease V) beta subunit
MFGFCPPRAPAAAGGPNPPTPSIGAAGRDVLLPIAEPVATHTAASGSGGMAAGEEDDLPGPESSRALGTVVHRLLQRLGTSGEPDRDAVAAHALRLLRPDELIALADRGLFAAKAASAYLSLCGNPDVRRFYAVPAILHEVPFVLCDGGAVVRGTIDCLVRVSPSEVAVLEFKTGRPRPEHADQLALYAKAAAALFPGSTVTPKLIYADLGVLP